MGQRNDETKVAAWVGVGQVGAIENASGVGRRALSRRIARTVFSRVWKLRKGARVGVARRRGNENLKKAQGLELLASEKRGIDGPFRDASTKVDVGKEI